MKRSLVRDVAYFVLLSVTLVPAVVVINVMLKMRQWLGGE